MWRFWVRVFLCSLSPAFEACSLFMCRILVMVRLFCPFFCSGAIPNFVLPSNQPLKLALVAHRSNRTHSLHSPFSSLLPLGISLTPLFAWGLLAHVQNIHAWTPSCTNDVFRSLRAATSWSRGCWLGDFRRLQLPRAPRHWSRLSSTSLGLMVGSFLAGAASSPSFCFFRYLPLSHSPLC